MYLIALKKMAEPQFDQYGRWIRPVRHSLPDTYNTYTSAIDSDGDSSAGLWSLLDGLIIDIGNWLARKLEDIAEWSQIIAGFGWFICLAVWVGTKFYENGLFSGILYSIGAFFLFGLGAVAIQVAGWLLGWLLVAMRYILWNIYSLLVTILIVGGVWLYANW